MAGGGVVGWRRLPAAPFELVGRDADVAGVVVDVGAARVVALTGVGGIGKTTLALAVARRLETAGRDAVLWAHLDTCVSAADVMGALVAAYGIQRRQGSRPDLEVLVAGLRLRRAVIVIDNCEHVVTTVADAVARVVDACADIRSSPPPASRSASLVSACGGSRRWTSVTRAPRPRCSPLGRSMPDARWTSSATALRWTGSVVAWTGSRW